MFNKIVATLLLAPAAWGQMAQAPARLLGITLPPDSVMIEKNRYRSARSFDETKKNMRERLAKLKNLRIEEINLPHLRAISYINSDKNAPFLSVNVYLNVQSGLTEIFFVENEPKS